MKTAADVPVHFRADAGHQSVLEIDPPYDAIVDGELDLDAREAVAREFLRTHADAYDFLVVFTGFPYQLPPGASAFYVAVRNDTQGIGSPPFDYASDFGSDGKLQGYVDMGPLSAWATDPTESSFERTLSVLVHELSHRWLARVRVALDGDPQSPLLLGADESHWSFLLDSDASVLYGNDWQDSGDGSFTSAAALRFLSPLDLYLAGFYAPEEVPAFALLDAPGVDRHRLPQPGASVQATARQLTVADVIAAEGPRVPAAADAQHHFRIAFLYLVQPGQPMDDPAIAALERVRASLITRFAILTGGRGAIEIYPEAPGGNGPDSPPPIDGGPPRSGPAVIADALAWLRAQQQTDKSWLDRGGTQLRDTAVVASTLAQLDTTFAGLTGGPLGWLQGRQEASTDSLARQALAVAALGGDAVAVRSRLLALQNPDGGWGFAAGYRSDPLDTALAVVALAPGGTSPALIAAGNALIASRGVDGGWSNHPGAPSRATTTAHVLRALHVLGRSAEVSASAVAWLATKQNGDGGFGDSPSTAHDTANVLLALMDVGRLGDVGHDAAAGFLRSRQTVAGSWEGSVYTTATVATALQRIAFPNWEMVSVTVDPPQPLEGQTVTLRARVRSSGNLPAPPGLVRFLRAVDGGAAV
ncbi:MAG TPA: prenyltransferase/squalene oxidase repeat-containing protein, partial [Thermoanaerobaculia bacterium]|nr:prenyltransferase/squalene oxidase repeat-containing protein [Thermoanaerobaculia bacterium]